MFIKTSLILDTNVFYWERSAKKDKEGKGERNTSQGKKKKTPREGQTSTEGGSNQISLPYPPVI